MLGSSHSRPSVSRFRNLFTWNLSVQSLTCLRISAGFFHVCTCLCVFVQSHMCMWVCGQVCMHVHVCPGVYVYVGACVYVCACGRRRSSSSVVSQASVTSLF